MKPRVLIIEDEKDMREVVEEVIKDEYEVIQAGTAEEGLEAVKRGGIDLILLDIRLPGMSGMQFLAELKKFDPQVEVIIVTAYPDIRNAVEATKLGAYDYIPKPFHNDDLLHTLHRAYANLTNHREILRLRSIVENTLKKIKAKEEKYTNTISRARASGQSNFELEELWEIVMTYKEELQMVQDGFEKREIILRQYSPISTRTKELSENSGEERP